MKSSPTAITIPLPCKSNWDEMSDTVKGKYCSSCAKNVFDLSTMSDQELQVFMKSHAGPICGRLHRNQLNRILADYDHMLLRRRFPNFFATAFLALASYQSASGAPPSQQAKIVFGWTNICESEIVFREPEELPGPDSLYNILQGLVIDSLTGEPLVYAKIHVLGTDIIVLTDELGNFQLNVPDDVKTLNLEISFTGHSSKLISVKHEYFQSPNKEKLKISLEYPMVYLGKLTMMDTKEFRRFKKMQKRTT